MPVVSTARPPGGETDSMPRDFEMEQHDYRPGLRHRGLRFVSDDEIELDFEGLDTHDRTFLVPRTEHASIAVWSSEGGVPSPLRGCAVPVRGAQPEPAGRPGVGRATRRAAQR